MNRFRFTRFFTMIFTVSVVLLLLGCPNPTNTADDEEEDEDTAAASLSYTDGTFYLVGNVEADGSDNYTLDAATEAARVSDGVYQKVLTFTATGDFAFQLANADWADKFTASDNITVGTTGGTLVVAGMANPYVTIPAAGSYLYKFDLPSKKVTVTADTPLTYTDTTFYLVGNVNADGSDNWTLDATTLATNPSTGVYEKTINFTSTGTFAFQLANTAFAEKFTGTSDVTPGIKGAIEAAEMENNGVVISEAGTYDFTFDLGKKTVTVVKQ